MAPSVRWLWGEDVTEAVWTFWVSRGWGCRPPSRAGIGSPVSEGGYQKARKGGPGPPVGCIPFVSFVPFFLSLLPSLVWGFL